MAKVFSKDSDYIINILDYNKKLQIDNDVIPDGFSVTTVIINFIKKYPDKLNKIHYVLNKHKTMIIRGWRFPNKNLIMDYLAETSNETNNFMDYLIYEYLYHKKKQLFRDHLDYLNYLKKYSDERLYPNMIPSYDILPNLLLNYDKRFTIIYLDVIEIFSNKININININSLHLLHRLTIDLRDIYSLMKLFEIYINIGKINILSKKKLNVAHYVCINNNIYPETKVFLLTHLSKFVNINLINKNKYKPFDYYNMKHKNEVNIWNNQLSNININMNNMYSILK